MILQSLYDYYDRKTTEARSDLAPFGFENKEIPFIFEIDQTGHLIQIEDTREIDGKKKIAKTFLVPKGIKKTSGIASNLLWENSTYVLGLADQKNKIAARKKNKLEDYRNRLTEMRKAFYDKIIELPDQIKSDEGIQAVLMFLNNLNSKDIRHWYFNNRDLGDEIRHSSPNMSFRLNGDPHLVCQRPEVIKTLKHLQEESLSDSDKEICLITGEQRKTTRLHSTIKGVWGAQTSGANIVSFNLDAFDSYGKSQGENAPVGEKPAFAYTTALNYLLRKGSPQRLQVGDTSTVFWAEKSHEFETGIVDIFGEPPKDDPDRNKNAVRSLFAAVHAGTLNTDEGNTRYFVLGLAPNSARISIRFWEISTVKELSLRIAKHFKDISIVHSDKQLPYQPLFRLLASTATQGKADNIPPNLAGETMRSIIAGLPYPQTLLGAAVRRVKAETEVTYPRAALIKACINRASRFSNSSIKEELKVSLDETNENAGYRLGRLFAVLEKIQEEASPGLNATIRDRYYGAASSTPVSVFSTLLKLKNHHLSKLESKGRAVNLEKLIGSIMDSIDDFPANLSLQDQGRFAIGYYHQRQDFFKAKPKETDPTIMGVTA